MRLKRILLQALVALGYEVRRRDDRVTMEGLLLQARANGLAPATVIDVGAGRGDFSASCAKIFPDARYTLVEPLSEFAAALRRLTESLPASVVIEAIAAAQPGTATVNVHPDLFGSSLYREVEGPSVDGTPRKVAATTLDDIVHKHDLKPPFLLKLDVQGAELDVLAGGANTIANTELAILEASMFGFFVHGPQFADIVKRMKDLGFVVYDMVGLAHRPLDGALAQADVAFVKEQGLLRQQHHFATPMQRCRLVKRFQT